MDDSDHPHPQLDVAIKLEIKQEPDSPPIITSVTNLRPTAQESSPRVKSKAPRNDVTGSLLQTAPATEFNPLDDSDEEGHLSDIEEFPGNVGNSNGVFKTRNGVDVFVCGSFEIPQVATPTIRMRSVSDLYTSIQIGKITINPSHKPISSWDNERASSLIHSILMGYYIPPLILNQEEETRHDPLSGLMAPQVQSDCIDGKQRLIVLQSFMNVVDGRETSSHNMIMPVAVKEFFRNRNICCYEYTRLPRDVEQRMARLSQGRIEPTAAEKMRTLSTPLANLVKQYEEEHSIVVNLSEHSRGSQFQIIATIFAQIQEIKSQSLGFAPSNSPPYLHALTTEITKVLDCKEPVRPSLKRVFKETFLRLEELIILCSEQQTATKYVIQKGSVFDPAPDFLHFRRVKQFSKTELLGAAVLVMCHSKRTNAELLDGIKDLRIKLRTRYPVLRINMECWTLMWEVIRDLYGNAPPLAADESLSILASASMDDVSKGPNSTQSLPESPLVQDVSAHHASSPLRSIPLQSGGTVHALTNGDTPSEIADQADVSQHQTANPVNDEVEMDLAESCTVYIQSLDRETTEESLKDFLSGYLVVSISLHKRSKKYGSFAFVILASSEEAERAIQQLSGQEFLSRKILIKYANKLDMEDTSAKERRAIRAEKQLRKAEKRQERKRQNDECQHTDSFGSSGAKVTTQPNNGASTNISDKQKKSRQTRRPNSGTANKSTELAPFHQSGYLTLDQAKSYEYSSSQESKSNSQKLAYEAPENTRLLSTEAEASSMESLIIPESLTIPQIQHSSEENLCLGGDPQNEDVNSTPTKCIQDTSVIPMMETPNAPTPTQTTISASNNIRERSLPSTVGEAVFIANSGSEHSSREERIDSPGDSISDNQSLSGDDDMSDEERGSLLSKRVTYRTPNQIYRPNGARQLSVPVERINSGEKPEGSISTNKKLTPLRPYKPTSKPIPVPENAPKTSTKMLDHSKKHSTTQNMERGYDRKPWPGPRREQYWQSPNREVDQQSWTSRYDRDHGVVLERSGDDYRPSYNNNYRDRVGPRFSNQWHREPRAGGYSIKSDVVRGNVLEGNDSRNRYHSRGEGFSSSREASHENGTSRYRSHLPHHTIQRSTQSPSKVSSTGKFSAPENTRRPTTYQPPSMQHAFSSRPTPSFLPKRPRSETEEVPNKKVKP